MYSFLSEYHSAICELEYAHKQQRLLCCGPWRSFMSAAYNIVLEWGYVDGSVRFFASESKKVSENQVVARCATDHVLQQLGLYEQLHQEEITTARFADTTLITASKDCTVGLWTVNVSRESVDLQPRVFLHGHRHAVTVTAVSRTLRTLLSADTTGRVLLWDLNTHELIRSIGIGHRVEVRVVAMVSSCTWLTGQVRTNQ